MLSEYRKEQGKKVTCFMAKYMFPRKCICSFCGKRFHRYLIHGKNSYITSKYNIVGMGERESDCPFCGCEDKHRWL